MRAQQKVGFFFKNGKLFPCRFASNATCYIRWQINAKFIEKEKRTTNNKNRPMDKRSQISYEFCE